MGAQNSQPDPNPDETRDDSTETESCPTEDPAESQPRGLRLSRRTALASLVGIGGLGLASSPAAAKDLKTWKKGRDAQGFKLLNLGTLAMQANTTEIASFEGDGLAIDGNGVLNVTVSDTRTDVSDDGTEVIADVEDIDFGANLAVTDDGDDSVTVDADTWDSRVDADGNDIVQIGGLQTLDNKTKIKDFEGANLTIDGSNVLNADLSGAGKWNDSDGDSLLEPNSGFEGIDLIGISDGRVQTTEIDTASNDFTLEAGTQATEDAKNIVLGHTSNQVTGEVVGSTISGGGFDDGSRDESNTISGSGVTGDFATISGGKGNNASGSESTIGGGDRNEATDSGTTVAGGTLNKALEFQATVGGGIRNEANAFRATVAGGSDNKALGDSATVAGGQGNEATGAESMIPGGGSNIADGTASFAAGRVANTNGHDGAFVLADSSFTEIKAQNDDEVRSQMPMYAPSFNSTSARAKKEAIEPVDSRDVLDTVTDLEVSTWEFKDNGESRHMGPMAGEFAEAFGLGDDDESIATVDADGVALAAIQGLSAKLDEKDDRIDDLEAELAARDIRIDDQRDRIDRLESTVERKDACIDDLEAENEDLRERLSAVEDRLTSLEAGQSSPAAADD